MEFGAGLVASLVKGFEDGVCRRAELGIPPEAGIDDPRVQALIVESMSPGEMDYLEGVVMRSWWTLYEDEAEDDLD